MVRTRKRLRLLSALLRARCDQHASTRTETLGWHAYGDIRGSTRLRVIWVFVTSFYSQVRGRRPLRTGDSSGFYTICFA